jgi:ABC-type multidrug transport system ATPase subunit
VGIAGTTGAGKSTLISLLTRLYDPTEGRILLDGEDLRAYARDDVRRQFAVVLQDTMLFSASVAENIAYALPNASREQIIAAAAAANAHEFIIQLPRGYDTEVGDRGLQLSGGQRQRVALARAFLKDSPILILDEPTSGVDTQTEAAIVDALVRLREGRTVITISHRPSAIAQCTALLTIEHGRIVADTARAATLGGLESAPQQELLLAHPAVQAWSRLNPERVIPDQITPADFKPNKPRRNVTVYRLVGVGPGGTDVIAKRCKAAYGRVERTVYERILPHVSLPGPHLYGAVQGGPGDPVGDVWLFMSEIHGEKYDSKRPDHCAAAARWLGVLHTEARAVVEHAGLPDAGSGRYRAQMHATRDAIRRAGDNPAITAAGLAFLDVLLTQFDELDEHWDRLDEACTGLPATLVHGDFNGKNIRVQQSSDGLRIAVFDWEYGGRGVPCIDLAQTRRITAAPDLAVYWSIVNPRWPGFRQADIDRLATCGVVFRVLASFAWESHHLVHPWANSFVSIFEVYHGMLVDALRSLGWPARATLSPVIKVAT